MITVRELAALAGVSPSTVSKALNNAQDVGPETKAKVQNLAREHGYAKSAAAKAAISAFTGPRVALIYSDITSRYFSQLVKCFEQRISEKNGIMFACDAQFSDTRAVQLCEYFQSGCWVDGIICISGTLELDNLPSGKVPMAAVMYSQNLNPLPFDYICVNEFLGVEEAVACLRRYGHRRIAYLGETNNKQRQNAFERGMKKNELPLEGSLVRVSQKRFEEAGYELMRGILRDGGELPTAVLCAYDDMAVGAAEAICEAGYRVPEDFSIVGIDNTQRAVFDHKKLASINSRIEEQVEIIVAVLTRKINNPDYDAVQSIVLQSEFIERETVGPCRKW